MTVQMASTGYLNNLTTKGSLSVDGTTLQNFDLGNKMRIVESLAGLKGGANTNFQKVAVTLAQNNDGTTLSDIVVIAPSIGELTGAGTVSPQKALALKMKVNLHTSGGVLTAVTGSAALSTGSIPFSVGGTVDNPQIHPDVGAIAKEAAKDLGKEATKSGLGILNDFLGGKKK
jgi:AsmA protein